MTITLAQYVAFEGINASISATINGQKISVPLNTKNRHYREIMRQVKAGTLTIADAD